MIHSDIKETPDFVIAENGLYELRVDKRAGEAKAFNRVTQSGDAKKRFLVGQLDDVKVYIDGNRILITKQDIYP